MNQDRCRRTVLNSTFETMVILSFIFMTSGSLTLRAEAGTLFVSPGGTGTTCNQVSPCSLQTALGQAADDDEIYLAGGTYTGTGGAVISLEKNISLYGGWDGNSGSPPVRNPILHPTTLDGENARRIINVAANKTVTVDGFIITNGASTDGGAGIRAEIASITIRGNQITGNTSGHDGGAMFINGGSAQILDNTIVENHATWSGGLRVINDANATITGNTIMDNTAVISAGGIDIDCCGNGAVIVSKNLIGNNDGAGRGGGVIVNSATAEILNNMIFHNQATSGAGIYVEGMDAYPSNVSIVHNTLVNDKTGGEAIWIGSYVNAALLNNIIVDHATGITNASSGGTTTEVDYNLFWDNLADGLRGNHPVDGDPLFLDPASSNFHIRADSPARDAGVSAGVSDDIDGEPRDESPDIGADEYTPTGPDLGGEWLSLSQTCKDTSKGQKCSLSGSLKVFNSGDEDASSTPVDFYLSDDQEFDKGQDTLLKSASTGKLKKDGSKSLKLKYKLQLNNPASGKYLIAVIDDSNAVQEKNESNNIVVFGPIP